MKFSKASLQLVIALLTLSFFAGCATQKEDRRLKMPTWFEGYDESEQPEDQQEEAATADDAAPESAADASDRISKQNSDQSKETEQPQETLEQAAVSESTSVSDTAETPIKLSPRPKKLSATNDKQAIEAQQAAPRYQVAINKLKAGELDNALLLFQELSAQYQTLSGPVINQAIILRKQGKLKEAKTLLQQQLLNKVQNPYLMTELGIVNRELGNFEAAKQAYLSAIRIEPNYDKAHYNLGVLADLYLHDPALAYTEFEAYQALQPQPNKKVAGWLKEIKRRIK